MKPIQKLKFYDDFKNSVSHLIQFVQPSIDKLVHMIVKILFDLKFKQLIWLEKQGKFAIIKAYLVKLLFCDGMSWVA